MRCRLIGVEHHAVGDQADLARVEDAAWDEVQDGFLARDHQRVAGVIAALVAHDVLRARAVEIHDLTLAFIAPLRADDRYVLH